MKSAKEAGIKIVTRFDTEDAAALKAELPWEQIRMLKRDFTETFGFDVFESEKELRNYIGKFEMPFESGTFANESAKSVNFVRVSDVKFVLKQLVEEMIDNNELTNLEIVGQNTLYVSLLGDKGGTSTKLLLQVLNTESQAHSNRYSKMIGIYEGDKENRDCIEGIFGGLMKDIQDTFVKIKSLQLQSHKICPSENPNNFKVHSTDDNLLVKAASKCPPELVKLDRSNVYFSRSCKLCKKQSSQSNLSSCPVVNLEYNNDDPTKRKKCE